MTDTAELWERRGEIFAARMGEGAWCGQPKGDKIAVAQIGALAEAVFTPVEKKAAAVNVRALVEQVLAERAGKAGNAVAESAPKSRRMINESFTGYAQIVSDDRCATCLDGAALLDGLCPSCGM